MVTIGRPRNLLFTVVFAVVSFMLLRPVAVYFLSLRASDFLNASIIPDAARTYRKVLFFNPGDSFTRNWLAYSYGLMGREDDSIREYKKVLEAAPDNLVANFDLGMYYWRKGDLDAAEPYFKRAAAAPNDAGFKESEYRFYANGAADMLKTIKKKR